MQHFVPCKMFYFYPMCLLSKVTLMLLMLGYAVLITVIRVFKSLTSVEYREIVHELLNS